MNRRKDKVVVILIIVSIIALVFSFFAPLIFTTSTKVQKFNFTETGAIGDTIGGLMNPFIALAGIFITFLAFYMQYKANQIQLNTFETNQKEQTKLLKEQLFFRMIDNLNQRIINFSHTETENETLSKTELSSYKALDNIIKRFLYKIDYKCIALGRQLLAEAPETLGDVHFFKIIQANPILGFPTASAKDELKKSIIEITSFNERWEYIKSFVGSTDNKNEKQNDALKSIGRVQFYKIDYSKKEDIYISSYDEIYKEFGGFMDGYLKNFTYLLNFINDNEENMFFSDYLKSNISTQELILIFYFCASRKTTMRFRNQVKKFNLFENLNQYRDRFIDLPSDEELTIEVENILKENINS